MAYLAQVIDDVVVSKFPLDRPKTTIGRRPESSIQINDTAVSGEHAVITVEKSQYLDGAVDIFLQDLGSTNGCFINDQPVKGKVRLADKDVVRVAWNKFQLLQASVEDLEGTAHILDL
ncbi:FHA domain-containing protein [Oceanicoccus sp. KOV_DT_Chl]|uniref:FHA domain-containing protein n=1 Tax=Oceanicoccus sp. KOV_DT_Chl TaxID=1904639 RepID=UPI000C7C3F0A|nr:FHA domain-containing protein [Oceanicoccus sp. KOV_DT_Chl]